MACTTSSIGFDWQNDLPQFMEMLTEYAFGATVGKPGVGYLNFLLQITPDCDCVPWSDAPIVPDVGILASTDPVAIDAASLDLVNQQQGLPGHSPCQQSAAWAGQVQRRLERDTRIDTDHVWGRDWTRNKLV